MYLDVPFGGVKVGRELGIYPNAKRRPVDLPILLCDQTKYANET